MALDLDLLVNEISNTEDFKSLYDELKRMNYFLYDHKIVDYSSTIVLDPKKDSAIDFLKKLVPELQRNCIISENKDEDIKLVNHFIFNIIIICYIWDAINEYKLQCNGKALIFTETLTTKPLAISYSCDHTQSTQIRITITVKAAKITGDRTTLFINVCTPVTSLTDSNYLSKIKITIFNTSAIASIKKTFTLSNLTVDNLRKLIEKAAALKK